MNQNFRFHVCLLPGGTALTAFSKAYPQFTGFSARPNSPLHLGAFFLHCCIFPLQGLIFFCRRCIFFAGASSLQGVASSLQALHLFVSVVSSKSQLFLELHHLPNVDTILLILDTKTTSASA